MPDKIPNQEENILQELLLRRMQDFLQDRGALVMDNDKRFSISEKSVCKLLGISKATFNNLLFNGELNLSQTANSKQRLITIESFILQILKHLNVINQEAVRNRKKRLKLTDSEIDILEKWIHLKSNRES